MRNCIIEIRDSIQNYNIFFVTSECAQKAGVLHYTGLERLSRDKYSNLFGPFVSYDDNEVPALLSSIMLGWKGLPGTNTLAYYENS